MKIATHIDISFLLLLFSAGFAIFGCFGVIVFLTTLRSPKKDNTASDALAKAQSLEAKVRRLEEVQTALEKSLPDKASEALAFQKSLEDSESKISKNISTLKIYVDEKIGEITPLKTEIRDVEEKLTSKILLLKQDSGPKALEALKELETRLTAKIDALSLSPAQAAPEPAKTPAEAVVKPEAPVQTSPKPAETPVAAETPPVAAAPAKETKTPDPADQEAKEILALMQKKKE